MKTTGEKLKDLRKYYKLSLDDLVKKINKNYKDKVSKSMVSRYENNKSEIPFSYIRTIRDLFNVDKDYFYEENIDFVPKNDSPHFSVKSLPLYGSIAAGALATINGKTKDDIQTVEIPSDILGKYVDDNDLFMMKVDGESMNKIIPNNSYVIVKPIDNYNDGDIVIFSHDGEYSLKRFLPHAIAGSLLFKAETTDDRIKDIVIPLSSALDTRIYGRVIWYSVILP